MCSDQGRKPRICLLIVSHRAVVTQDLSGHVLHLALSNIVESDMYYFTINNRVLKCGATSRGSPTIADSAH